MTLRDLLLAVAAVALLATTPAVADGETCWVCGENAECEESTLPNFARKSCQERRVCHGNGCVEFCATGSDECAIEDPGNQSPWWPFNSPQFSNMLILAAHPDSTDTVTRAFNSLLVGVLASQQLQGRDVGRGDGVIAFDGAKQSYRFSRRVEVDRGSRLVTAAYRIKNHPTYTRLIVESPSRGVDLFVTVEQVDGSQRFEAFTFDPFGTAPDPADAGPAPDPAGVR